MGSILQPYEGLVVRHSSLMSLLSDYQAPNFKIHRWLDEGQLISLKRGLYAVPSQTTTLSLPLMANHLYGPSYVSLEFMLSYFGLIPERVAQVTSVTTRRGKLFNNTLGRFSYQHLPPEYYSMGIERITASPSVSFMAASVEKAVCDWLVLTSNLKIYSTKGLRELLLDDMRMDEFLLSQLDVGKVVSFAASGHKSTRLNWLVRLLEEGV